MAFDFPRPIPGVCYVEIPVSGITTNVYVIGPPEESLLVDCGGAASAGEVIETLEGNGYGPEGVQAIVVTHGHLDHYGGAAALVEWCGAPVWAHLGAAVQIEDHRGDFIKPGGAGENASAEDHQRFRAGAGDDLRVERVLREGDVIEHASMRLEVLHMPGHQRGLVTLFEPDRRLAFVGDLVQGGMDCSANWLGLFEDAAGQQRSLERLRALEPAWLFKAHRVPRSADDVPADIAAALGRLDAIEAALIETLEEASPITVAHGVRAVFRKVLDMDVQEVRNYAIVTVTAFLIDLAQRGRARRTADLAWEIVEA